MNNRLPLVSFVIPTHNRAYLLKECLDSVLNQTYKNIEVIVVNDDSSDNTLDILKKYITKYPNLYYYNNEGKGGNAARNLGVIKAKGEYIAFMDDDDICEPFRIEEQMRPIITSNYEYDFVISGFTTYQETKKKYTNDYLKPMKSVGFPQRWLIKKRIISKANYFDINQPALQDVEFFFRLKEYARIFYNPVPVVRIRTSLNSITKDIDKMNQGIKRLLNLHGNKMDTYERNLWLITLCKKHASAGDWNNFYNCYKNMNKIRTPFSSLLLFISYLLESINILKFHSKGLILYYKLLSISKYNQNNTKFDHLNS